MKSDYIETPYGLFSTHLKGAKLSEICDSVNGIQTGPFGSQLHQADYVPSGIPIITVEHLGDNRILHENVPCVNEKDYRRLIKYRLEKGDIVFSRVGSVDRRALVRQDEDGWLFSGRCLRVRPDSEAIDSEYLSWFFGATPFQDHIRKIAVGATMPSLNTKILSDLPIYFPPLPEQKAIARILSSLDDKIELNRRTNATLEQMAQALFRAWFVDFEPVKAKAAGLQPTSADAQTAALFPSELVESELGVIPKGWEVKTISDLTEINSWSIKKADHFDTIGYIEISEVFRGNIANITPYKFSEAPSRARRRLRHGDTVLSTVRPDRGAYFLSLHPASNLIASTGFAVVSPTKAPWSYIHAMLTQDAVSEYLGNLADGGAYPAVRSEVIGNWEFAWKSEELPNAFHELCAPLYQKIHDNRIQSQTLTQLRDTLLPRLISGRLRVPEAEKIISET